MVAQAIGYKARLLLGYEATYGATPAVPTAVVVPFNSNSVKSTQNLVEPSTITGIRDPVLPARGNIDVAGSVVVPVDVTAIGYWLKLLMGAPTTTGTAALTHIFTTRATAIPSAILETQFSDIATYRLLNGCKVSSLSMSFGGDGELTASIDMMGANETISATAVATATTIALTRFNNFQATIKEGGTTSAICTAVDIKIDTGLDNSVYCIGGAGIRESLPEGIYAISGNVKALFANSTLLNKAINGTESSLQITLTNGTNSLDITLPEVMYERNSPVVDGPKGILVDLPFKAYFQDDAAASACKITLINAQASY